jgi:hypothetical protein
LRPHREMLDTAGDPVEAEGIGTVKLTLRGKFNHPLVLKNVYFAATHRNEPDQRAETATRPLLGGGAPTERLCATPRTNRGDRLLSGGGSVDPAVLCEPKIPRTSPTGEGADEPCPCRFPGTAGGGHGRRRPSRVKWCARRGGHL